MNFINKWNPVRYVLSGSADRINELSGEIKSQLFSLKEQMRLGNLNQLSNTRVLSDGSTIQCFSSFGMDTVVAQAPFAILSEKEEEDIATVATSNAYTFTFVDPLNLVTFAEAQTYLFIDDISHSMECVNSWDAVNKRLTVTPSYKYIDYALTGWPEIVVPQITPVRFVINSQNVIVGGFDSEAAYIADGGILSGRYQMTYRGEKRTSLNSGDGINGGYGLDDPTRNYSGTLGTRVETEGAMFVSRKFYLTAAGLAYEYTGYDIPANTNSQISAKDIYILGGSGICAVSESMDNLAGMRFRVRFTGLGGATSNLFTNIRYGGIDYTGTSLGDRDAQDIVSGCWVYFENTSWLRLCLEDVNESVTFQLVRIGSENTREFRFFPEHLAYAIFTPPYWAANTISV